MNRDTHATVERSVHDADSLWTQKNVAEYLDIPHNTVARWRVNNVGPRFIRIGKYVRYRKADVDRWIESQTVA